MNIDRQVADDAATAEIGDATMIALAAVVRAVDPSGGVARQAATLMRLAATLSDLSGVERDRLMTLTRLFEGLA